MIRRRINAAMSDVLLWQHCTEACRQAFTRDMRGLKYGLIECQDAFWWFVKGWKAADVTAMCNAGSQVNSEQSPSEPVPEDLKLVRGAE
jgi:hypothetical protein